MKAIKTIIFLTILYTIRAQSNILNVPNPSFPSFAAPKLPTMPSLPSIPLTSFGCDTQCGWNTFEMFGIAKLDVKPDTASITVQLSENGVDSKQAVSRLSTKMALVISTLTTAGLDASNWQTTSFNINPNTSYVNGVVVTYGQIATQSMEISIPITSANGNFLGTLYDSLAKIDSININNLNFDLKNKTASLTQARKLAYDAATKKANDYASAAGVTIGSPITVVDSSSFFPAPVVSGPTMRALAMSTKDTTTVTVGTITLDYKIGVIFNYS